MAKTDSQASKPKPLAGEICIGGNNNLTLMDNQNLVLDVQNAKTLLINLNAFERGETDYIDLHIEVDY